MYPHVLAFVQTAAECFSLKGPVYQEGLLATPGATSLADLPELLIDVRSVDSGVPSSQRGSSARETCRLPLSQKIAHTVICVNPLQQARNPREVMDGLIGILAPGGLLLSCCLGDATARDCPRSGLPTPAEMQNLLSGLDATLVGWLGADRHAHTLYAIGCRSPVPTEFAVRANRFMERFQARLTQIHPRDTWAQKIQRLLGSWRERSIERAVRRDYLKVQFLLDLPLSGPSPPHWLTSCPAEGKLGSRLDRNG